MDGQAYHDEEAGEAAPRTDEAWGAHPWLHEAVALRTGSSLEPLVYEAPVQIRLNRPRALRVAPFVKIDAAQGV